MLIPLDFLVTMSAPANLDDLLECSVCLEPLGLDHKVLPCQHTFCVHCLQDIEDASKKDAQPFQMLCPECRSPCSVPLEDLPTNVILNRILEGLRSGGKNSPVHFSGDQKIQNADVPSRVPGNPATNPFVAMMQQGPIGLQKDLNKRPKLPPKPSQPTPSASLQDLPQLALRPSRPPPAPPGPAKPVSMEIKSTGQQRPLKTQGLSLGLTPSAGHQIYRAMYDYNPCKPDELALQKNHLYVVTEKCQDGWYKGSAIDNLKTGVFPGNYVQHIQQETTLLQPTKVVSPSRALTPHEVRVDSAGSRQHSQDLIDLLTDNDLAMFSASTPTPPVPPPPAGPKPPSNLPSSSSFNDVGSSARVASSPVPPASAAKPPEERYRCIMAFPSSSQYELDLKEGDFIILLKARDDGWCKGRQERTGQVGLFPITFVKKATS